MFISKLMKTICTCTLIIITQIVAADDVSFGVNNPNLGKVLSAEYVDQVDFVVMPNGDGLPQGSGNAVSGKELFNVQCIACHGNEAKDGINGDLAGGHGTINGPSPKKTVGSYWPYATILFDYIRRAMPYQSPGTLTNDEIYALTAYILYLNDIVTEKEIMSSETLPRIIMPNSEGFVWAYSASE